jgi:DNA-binding transcriptional MocR family regulator
VSISALEHAQADEDARHAGVRRARQLAISVWARFAHIEDAATLSETALRDGVMLAPGAVFRPNLEPSPYMRFNVAFHDDPRCSGR